MRNQTNIKRLVGRKDNEYYICDYLFEKSKDFKGATATVLCPVSKAIYEERTDPKNQDTLDWFKENWQMAVQAGNTTNSLQEFVEYVLAVDGDEAVFDMGGYEYWDLLREIEPELTEDDYPIFECVGGGRSFSPDMGFDKIYDNELWERIKEIETR